MKLKLLLVVAFLLMAGVFPAYAQEENGPVWLSQIEYVKITYPVYIRIGNHESAIIGNTIANESAQILANWGTRSLVRTATSFGWVDVESAGFQTIGSFVFETTCEAEAYTPLQAQVTWTENENTYYLYDIINTSCSLIFDGQMAIYDTFIHDLIVIREGISHIGSPYTVNGIFKFAGGTIAAYPSSQAFSEPEAGKLTDLSLKESWEQDILMRLEQRLPEVWTLKSVNLLGEFTILTISDFNQDHNKSCQYTSPESLVQNAFHMNSQALFEGAIGAPGCITIFEGRLSLTTPPTAEAWYGIREGFLFSTGNFTVMNADYFASYIQQHDLALEMPTE